jgi:hypothetical protein
MSESKDDSGKEKKEEVKTEMNLTYYLEHLIMNPHLSDVSFIVGKKGEKVSVVRLFMHIEQLCVSMSFLPSLL